MSPSDAGESPGQSIETVLVTGLIGGGLVGCIVGAVDGALSLLLIAQMVEGPVAQLLVLTYLAAAYGIAGACVGLFVRGAELVVLRRTRIGDIVRAGYALHEAARVRDPRDALSGLALVLTGVPMIGAVLLFAYALAVTDLAERRHPGLVVAAAMLIGIAALLLGTLLTFVLGAAVEALLRRVARRDVVARRLSAPLAPVLAFCLLALLAAAGIAASTWQTLVLLPLRPFLAAAAVLLALGFGFRLVRHRVAWFTKRPARLRAGAYVASAVTLIAALLLAGAADGVLAAANRYSGLGRTLTGIFRTIGDFDRDGYSWILGGGDCNDFDPTIHPGAREIPGDGIDQNCVGGDGIAERSLEDVKFAAVPNSVPDDFNVIVLTIDTIRADHVGAYGYARATTPTLDALAADGTLFLNAWAHAPSTRYSMPAIFTGRYPLAVFYEYSLRGWPGIQPRALTIAEILSERGFYTGGIFNYWYFDEGQGLNQGFRHYDNTNKRLHKEAGGKGPAKTTGSSSSEQTDKALEFIASNAGRRFMLWVHYYDPHYAYEFHPEVTNFGDQEIDRYDNEILFTDTHIARLVADVKRRGLYDKTVFVVTGDHGEGFGEHQTQFHGYDLYAAQTKVPLIVRVPGLPPKRVAMPVAHIDLLPTLANLAGAGANDQMQGRSLVDVMTGAAPAHADRWVFQQLSHGRNSELRAAASLRCHVLFNVSPENTWELYRIDEDPMETREVSGNPGPCASAPERLEAWYEQTELEQDDTGDFNPAAIDDSEPLNIDLGAEIRLRRVRLPSGPVRPNDSVEVGYDFDVVAPITGNWRVLVHFEAKNGGRFTDDHAPEPNFDHWPAGESVSYTRQLRVPSTALRGRYIMWVGLYRGRTRKPLRTDHAAVLIEDDRAAVGALTVHR